VSRRTPHSYSAGGVQRRWRATVAHVTVAMPGEWQRKIDVHNNNNDDDDNDNA